MRNFLRINSPLEQFQIVPLYNYSIFGVDVSVTNATVVVFLLLLITAFFVASLVVNTNIKKLGSSCLLGSYKIIPNKFQVVLEEIYKVVLSLVVDNVKVKENAQYFPIVFFIFLFITSVNVIGLIPYSFTITSHIIVTLTIALSVFLGVVQVGVRKHKIKYFSLFLPAGTSVLLALLLVPIELMSFIFKPISLAIRLFANMMAGHTLLKVIAGFAYTLSGFGGVLFLAQYVPLLMLVVLFVLEVAVALIQAFVFSILVCIYLNESLNLH